MRAKDIALLLLLTASAILVHGYHPFVEDAEIYVPGIRKALNPPLYPFNQQFFSSHARLTLFPNLIAISVRITHLQLEWSLLAWHFACIFMLLFACWRLGRICFGTARAAWGGAALVAALLTMPIAGTALYIMDQYLNTRSFSTAMVMWIVLSMLEKKYLAAAGWVVLTVLIHPLMACFGIFFAGLLVWRQHASSGRLRQVASATSAVMLFPPVTDAYRQVLNSHSYFFLLRWEWYEWLGIFGPLIIFWGFAKLARHRDAPLMEVLCMAATWAGFFFFVAGMLITIPRTMMRFAELQPMRGLQLVYILLLVIGGGVLSEYVLRARVWRWLALFAPLCAGMFYAQRQLFPSTAHMEWPQALSANPWVQSFDWIRMNTPVNAYFALDPDHMRLPGEDQHGFRAIAERSMLADRVKDSGAVTMFPELAQTWLGQVNDERGWTTFSRGDFKRLHTQYGVNWVVLQQPGVPGLDCRYQNRALLVCQIAQEPEDPTTQ